MSQNYAELFRAIGGATPNQNFGSYINSGRQVLDLLQYEVKTTEEKQTIVAAEFLVVESVGANGEPPHAPGSKVTASWRMTGLVKDWQIKKEMARAQGFVVDLLEIGATVQQILASGPDGKERATAYIQSEALKLNGDDQPGRGRRIIAFGGPPGPGKDGKKGFVDVTWAVCPGANDPQQVAARRAQYDQMHPVKLQRQMGAAVAAAPSYGHAMQAAPPPAAPPGYMPQGYTTLPPAAYGPNPGSVPPQGWPPVSQPTAPAPAPAPAMTPGYPPQYQPPTAPAPQYPPGYGPAPVAPAPAYPGGYPGAAPVPAWSQQPGAPSPGPMPGLPPGFFKP